MFSPWNLPLLLLTWKVGPALACGNTVVAKPSEVTPSTAALLGEVMNEVGIPEGVYNVVHGFGETTSCATATPTMTRPTSARWSPTSTATRC
jgi:aminomuconate-semialdehyde/2-hydroxymuconate-6-semialdehyde dehydrogenase